MERRIRWLGIVMVLCFFALFIQLNNIQILKAHSLSTSANNPRVVAVARNDPRGDILSADGIVLASSVPSTTGYYKYQRVYNPYTALLFGQITGFDSIIYGKTGAVESMFGFPTSDPTQLSSPNINVEKYAWAAYDPNSPLSPLVSRTFQRGFLPGSTFKVVTSAAVYDHQPALAKLDIPVAQCISLEPQSDKPLCNYGHESAAGAEACGGVLTVTLPASCDTAFATLGMDLGGKALTAEAQAFGFNQVPPIDLPGAFQSSFPADPGNDPGFNLNKPSQAYSAFGQQNVDATALQMALVADGIANRGVIMTPHVMSDIHDSSGNLITTYQPKPWLTATNPLTAAAVTSLMQSVVTEGTASTVGFPASWNVAAKTGTAETGPNASLTNDWMIAFAPANDPKVAVAVVIPNQGFSKTGAEVAGPPMKTILGDALEETP